MKNSKIISFLYQKWLVMLSWYNSSVLSKLLKGIYSSVSNAWSDSFIVKSFCKDKDNTKSKSKSLIYKLFYLPFSFLSLFANERIKNLFEKAKNTALYKSLYCIVNNLFAISTRFIGVFLLFASLIYMFADKNLPPVLCAGAVIISLLMCIFDFSVLSALKFSIVQKLLKLFLSIEPELNYYDENELHKKYRLPLAALCGVLFGFCAAYISPVIAAGIIGALLVMYRPIFGVAITVFAIPFLPTMMCAGLAILCFFALFVYKSLHADKEWKLDKVGFALILFMIIIAICSVTSVARENSITICLLCFALMSFYFTLSNTIKTKEQFYTILRIFTISALFVAAYGIIQYVFGLDMDKQAWIDEEMFTDIKMRAFSTLENPNVLGEYLLLTIPVAIAFMWNEKKALTKLTYIGISCVLLLCLVLTMSRGCWIGLLVAAALFITFVDARYWALGILILFIAPSILPASILNRFLSIGNLGDSSSSYRMFIWLGSISMLKDFWLVGIGPGSQAYNLIYPRYSYSGIIAPHAHSVYLQQMVETGVVGIGALIFIFIMFFKKMSSVAHSLAKKSPDRIMAIALAAGVCGFLVQGVFDYVFYNYRVYMMFWMFLSFGSVLYGIIKNERVDEND